MPHPFDGINAKLNRSRENILNLDREITRFFQASKYPVIADENQKIIPEAVQYHLQLEIPPRFAVLAGEIVHHLRSCLDHVVWQFSSRDSTTIEFPVCRNKPTTSKELERYEGKIKGITNSKVLSLISDVQPYRCPNPIDSPLFIIHKFDLADKHKELVIVAKTGAVELPIDLIERYMLYKSGIPNAAPVDLGSELNLHKQLVPQVAFKDFGSGEPQIVRDGLTDLQHFVVYIVGKFNEYI